MPRLFLASDHRGFADKQRLITVLNSTNVKDVYEIIDLGPTTLRPDDDFNDAAIAVARNVRQNPASRGILICGYTPELVHIGRLHEDANVLCLSSDFMDDATMDRSISMFLSAEFLPEERYIRRVTRLDEENIY